MLKEQRDMQNLVEAERQKNQTLQRQLRKQVQYTQRVIENEKSIRESMQSRIDENCGTGLEQINIIGTLTNQLDAMQCHLRDCKDAIETRHHIDAETLKKESKTLASIQKFDGAVEHHLLEVGRAPREVFLKRCSF